MNEERYQHEIGTVLPRDPSKRPDIAAITQRWRQTTSPQEWRKDWNVKTTHRTIVSNHDETVAYALGPKTTPFRAEKDAEFIWWAHRDIEALVRYVAYLEGDR